ncbi:MAG TPA: hypothetical protein VGJ21_14530, partial [Terracidiphilus sp.]
MRFLSPDIGVVNNRDPIPLHISTLGPRARALTAQLGAHWIYGVGHIDEAKAAISAMQAAWHQAGIEPQTRVATAFCGGCVLADSEPFDSPRARAQAGPHATIVMHNLVELEQFGNLGRTIPSALSPLLALILMYLGFRYLGLSVGGLFSPEMAQAPWS